MSINIEVIRPQKCHQLKPYTQPRSKIEQLYIVCPIFKKSVYNWNRQDNHPLTYDHQHYQPNQHLYIKQYKVNEELRVICKLKETIPFW
jgi:hypothetical protein